MRKLSLLYSILLLAGCAGAGDPMGTLFSKFDKAALPDLQNAATLAKANGDEVALACWTAAVKHVQDRMALPPAPNLGAARLFTTIQTLRDARLGTGAADLKIGCAALIKEEEALVLKAIATGGISLMPSLP